MATSSGTSTAAPRLRRVLTLWDLVLYGIILIQPTAPMPLFGVVHVKAQGHVATTIFIGMFAMVLTAMSYGRMARAYPSAGSAYTFVGREIHPHLGFLTGWSMLMDYVLNPVICVIWCSKEVMKWAPLHSNPQVTYTMWAVFFACLFTFLNLRGIKATARMNAILTAAMSVVIIAFITAAVRYLFGHNSPVFSTQPFYDPNTFSWNRVSTGTSLAVLTYIGFDGISTLSEDVENPRRNVLLATVLVCVVTGILGGIEVYFAQRVWPDYWSLPDADTGFVWAAKRAGGPILSFIVGFTLVVASIGSGSGAQLGSARVLYGMGRDNVISRRFFGYLDPRRNTPRNNILLTGFIALTIALLPGSYMKGYERGAELLNFGAFIAFMGVNISAFTHYFLRGERSFRNAVLNLFPPLLGFLVCAYIWWSLSLPARIGGATWLAIGIAYSAWKTNFFRTQLVLPDVPPED